MTPQWIRTLIDAKPREFGYTVIEYDLVTGTWVKKEIKVTETHMRVEEPGQQFEVYNPYAPLGWSLVPKNVWTKDFETFLEARKKNNYTGEYPQPVF